MKVLVNSVDMLSVTSPPLHPPSSCPSRSPLAPSHSSQSIHPQPSVSSEQSSQICGSGFIPSHHTSPALAQRGSLTSESVSSRSDLTWNPIVPEPEISFTPDMKAEVDFFSPSNARDIDTNGLWNLVEERKLEDKLLRAEFGWESQSAFTDSQTSQQQRCQSRDALLSLPELEENENTRSRDSKTSEKMNLLEGTMTTPKIVTSLVVARAETRTELHGETLLSKRAYEGDIAIEEEEQTRLAQLPCGALKQQWDTADEDEDEDEDGIPWF